MYSRSRSFLFPSLPSPPRVGVLSRVSQSRGSPVPAPCRGILRSDFVIWQKPCYLKCTRQCLNVDQCGAQLAEQYREAGGTNSNHRDLLSLSLSLSLCLLLSASIESNDCNLTLYRLAAAPAYAIKCHKIGVTQSIIAQFSDILSLPRHKSESRVWASAARDINETKMNRCRGGAATMDADDSANRSVDVRNFPPTRIIECEIPAIRHSRDAMIDR